VRAPLLAWLDRIGMVGAGLCAVHCAALPLLLMWLPLSALSIAARGTFEHELARWVIRLHGYERALLAAALVLACISLLLGWLRHGCWSPGALGLAAAGALGWGLFGPPMSGALHVLLLVGGSLLLGLAHWRNLRVMCAG
jgi:hypothetical protein